MKALAAFLLVLPLWLAAPLFAGAAPEADIEEQTRAISAELRCVVCQNLSVADSPSDMAQQMRAIVREQVAAGKSPQEIKDYFVSKYGEWVLLAPTKKGFSLFVWVVPFIVLGGGLIFGVFLLRRWTKRKTGVRTASADPEMLARVRAEASLDRETLVDLEDSSRHSQLLQERARFYADLKELDFDYHAGKLSEADYTELRNEVETRAAAVLQQLDREGETIPETKPQPSPRRPASRAGRERMGMRGWQLGLAASFLLIFGVVVGVMLSQSIRPRTSPEESITGDFLTGTASARGGTGNVSSLLQEAGTAISKEDWPTAIEAVKKVLALDPNQPEAHAYMGYILFQANHADGALMAFDKALSLSPNTPIALWGKGMTLYQAKQDYAGAREVFQQLLKIVPAGSERAEVEKILAEIPQSGNQPVQPKKPAPEKGGTPALQIAGKISIDPKLKSSVDGQAVLFIIARAGGGAPVAVKKVDRPVFPLSYTLGSENVMMQGASLSGKLMLSARLDKDGNPMTREPGSLIGEHKTPVDAGAHNVDFVIDQIAR